MNRKEWRAGLFSAEEIPQRRAISQAEKAHGFQLFAQGASMLASIHAEPAVKTAINAIWMRPDTEASEPLVMSTKGIAKLVEKELAQPIKTKENKKNLIELFGADLDAVTPELITARGGDVQNAVDDNGFPE